MTASPDPTGSPTRGVPDRAPDRVVSGCPTTADCPTPRVCPPPLPAGWKLMWGRPNVATVIGPVAGNPAGFTAVATFDTDGQVTLAGDRPRRPDVDAVTLEVLAWVVAAQGPSLTRQLVLAALDDDITWYTSQGRDAAARSDTRTVPLGNPDADADRSFAEAAARTVAQRSAARVAETLPSLTQRQVARALVAAGFTGTLDELAATAAAVAADPTGDAGA